MSCSKWQALAKMGQTSEISGSNSVWVYLLYGRCFLLCKNSARHSGSWKCLWVSNFLALQPVLAITTHLRSCQRENHIHQFFLQTNLFQPRKVLIPGIVHVGPEKRPRWEFWVLPSVWCFEITPRNVNVKTICVDWYWEININCKRNIVDWYWEININCKRNIGEEIKPRAVETVMVKRRVINC